MAPRMLHPQLRRGFFKERGVREIDRRRKFHFSFLLSFTRKLSAIFSARNLKMAEKPPVKWPPVLGHHAAIRRAPDSFSSRTATVALFHCWTIQGDAAEPLRPPSCRPLRVGCAALLREDPPLCPLVPLQSHTGCSAAPSLSPQAPPMALTWNGNQGQHSVAFIAHSHPADGPGAHITLNSSLIEPLVGGCQDRTFITGLWDQTIRN